MLAKCLEENNSLQRALEIYEAFRLPRTSKVQARSRQNATTFHRRSAPMRIGTYAPMWLAGHLAPEFVHSRMDWLYGYESPAVT